MIEIFTPNGGVPSPGRRSLMPGVAGVAGVAFCWRAGRGSGGAGR
jgi:hypothetical protein